MANKTICALTYGDTHVFTLPYGTCSTAAGTAAKTVAVQDGKFSLETGARVCVKFSNTNTAASPTLNVSGTGAKAIMYRGSAISAGYLAANKVYDFIYDGTDWELIGDINTNTTNLGSMSGTLPVSKGGTGATAANGARTNLGITTEFLNSSHNHDNGSLNPNSIEMRGASNHGGYIDFHYGGSSANYTSRIIESSNGVVTLNGSPILTEANSQTSGPATFFSYVGTGPAYKDTYTCSLREIELPFAPSYVAYLAGINGLYGREPNQYTCVEQGTTKTIADTTYFKLQGNKLYVCDYYYHSNSGLDWRANTKDVTYLCVLIK